MAFEATFSLLFRKVVFPFSLFNVEFVSFFLLLLLLVLLLLFILLLLESVVFVKKRVATVTTTTAATRAYNAVCVSSGGEIEGGGVLDGDVVVDGWSLVVSLEGASLVAFSSSCFK